MDDSRMEYKCECNECECSSKWNDNINKCKYNILCDNIAGMYSMKIQYMMSSSMSELCSMKFKSSGNDI